MLAFLLKQRRFFTTFTTVACLIYTSCVTYQLLKALSNRGQCQGDDKTMRRMMPRHYRSDEAEAAMEEGMKRARDTMLEANNGRKTKPYRLDIIRDDLERLSQGKDPNEKIDEIEDKTDYFGCSDFDRIPRMRKQVEENLRGNRGISFIKVRINGVTIPSVLKEANRLYRTVVEEYKYNSAKREILYLTKLRGIRGIPRIFGSCVTELRIRYLVERVHGLTLCNDNGTTPACAAGDSIADLVKHDLNPQFAALAFAYSTTTFFQQLEDRHLFMEDVSGLNFMVSQDWQLYMVDADSLVFYNDSRIYSHVSCNADDHCPSPKGNLWVDFSLNMKIYKKCRDLTGICDENECRGFGTELHACGLANWYLCRLSTMVSGSTPEGKIFRKVCACMSEIYPHNRCTFREASSMLRDAIKSFMDSKGQNLPI